MFTQNTGMWVRDKGAVFRSVFLSVFQGSEEGFILSYRQERKWKF